MRRIHAFGQGNILEIEIFGFLVMYIQLPPKLFFRIFDLDNLG